MKNVIALLCGLAISQCLHAQSNDSSQSLGASLDSQLFNAYNACDLNAFGNLLALDIEFYHDKGGLMVGRQSVITAVEKNICGKVRRELIAGTLKSFPMDKYGILQLGEHRFCTFGTDKCDGIARFVHLWRHTDGAWHATRIFSYDHQQMSARSNKPGAASN